MKHWHGAQAKQVGHSDLISIPMYNTHQDVSIYEDWQL